MLDFLTIFSALLAGKEIVKEKLEKPRPANVHFDWDAYWEDIENGISCTEQLRKQKRGDYYTTRPQKKKWYELPLDTVADIERYEYEKEIFGERMVEEWRKYGRYREIKKF